MSSIYISFGNGRWNKIGLIYRESWWKWKFSDFLAEVSKTLNHIEMKASILKMKKKPGRIDKMQLNTKNDLNRIKNKGVMVGYVNYAKSGFLVI